MKQINVLSIGNSFSQDAHRYLHDIGINLGVNINCVNLYIGGCPFERHFRNVLGDKRDYGLEINGHSATGFFTSIKEALLSRSWDYVTLQQASIFSVDFESFEPYLSELAAHIRKLCPKAKILIHQTWGYETGSPKLEEKGFKTNREMLAVIEKNYEMAAKAIDAEGIIPCGKALSNALENGIETIHRDGYHAGLGLGRFILGLTFFKKLTGESIDNVTYNVFDAPVTEEEYKIAIKSVNQAL